MRQTEKDGKAHWRCAFCLQDYPSRAAARKCEDEHLDEHSLRRHRGSRTKQQRH